MQTKNTPAVTVDYLTDGAYYALEQCGILLRDAVAAYGRESYGSAIAFAAFAREELGKSRLLEAFAKRVASGQTMTVGEVRAACDDHEEKQRQAALSVELYGTEGSTIDRALRTKTRADPQSREAREADEQLRVAAEAKQKRAPAERARLREQGLYVDPDDAGTSWSRPNETPKEDARRFIEHAANDFSGARERFGRNAPTEIAKRDVLPAPQWPE